MTHMEPETLRGISVLLSASFPAGVRAVSGPTFDVEEVADAVTAISRAVLHAGGRLAFGGHPTISPLVMYLAGEHGRRGSVDIYQSRWFDQEIPTETRRMQELGLGAIHWTPAAQSLSGSLRTMRIAMIREGQPDAAVFVGGMDGIVEEWNLVGDLAPGALRFPIVAPGGAASRLPIPDDVRDTITEPLDSRRYPLIAMAIVALISRHRRGPGSRLSDQ